MTQTWLIEGTYKNNGRRFSWTKKFKDKNHAISWKINKNNTHSFSKFIIIDNKAAV